MDPQYFFHLNDEVAVVSASLELTPKAHKNISAEEDFHNLFRSPSPYKNFSIRPTSPGNFPPGFAPDPILYQAFGTVVGASEGDDDDPVGVEGVYTANGGAVPPLPQQHQINATSMTRMNNAHHNSSIEQVFTQLQEQQVIPLPLQQVDEAQHSAFFHVAMNGNNQSLDQQQMQQNDIIHSMSPKQLSKVPKRKRTSRNRSNKRQGGMTAGVNEGMQEGEVIDTDIMNIVEQTSIQTSPIQQSQQEQDLVGSLTQELSMEPMPVPLVDNNGDPVTNDMKIIQAGQQVAMSRLLYPFPAQSRRPSRNPQCCNCRKSGCMKLYCVCFSNGMYCSDACNCTDCKNDITNCVAIKAAWEYIIEQNPSGSLHCKCRKSRCRKSYCKCYEAGHKCGPWCGCVGCNNTEEGLKIEDQRQKSLKPTNSDINDTRSEFNGGPLMLPLDSPYTSNGNLQMMLSQNTNTPLALAPPPNFNASTLPPPHLSNNSGQTGPIVILPHEVTDQGLPTGNLTLGYLQKTGPNVFKFFSTTPDNVNRMQVDGQTQGEQIQYNSSIPMTNNQHNSSSMTLIPLTPNQDNSEQTITYGGNQPNNNNSNYQTANPYWLSYQYSAPKLVGGSKQVFVTDEISYNKYPPVFLNYQEMDHMMEDTTTAEEDQQEEEEFEEMDSEQPFFTPSGEAGANRPALPLLTPLGQDGLLPIHQANNHVEEYVTSPNPQIYSDGTTQSMEQEDSPHSYVGTLVKIGQPITSAAIVRGYPVDYFTDKSQFSSLLDDRTHINFQSNSNDLSHIFNLQPPSSSNPHPNDPGSAVLDENEEFNRFIANFRTHNLPETDITLEDILGGNVHEHEEEEDDDNAPPQQQEIMMEGFKAYQISSESHNNNDFNITGTNQQQNDVDHVNARQITTEGLLLRNIDNDGHDNNTGVNVNMNSNSNSNSYDQQQQMMQGFRDFRMQPDCVENLAFEANPQFGLGRTNFAAHKKGALQDSSVQNSPIKWTCEQKADAGSLQLELQQQQQERQIVIIQNQMQQQSSQQVARLDNQVQNQEDEFCMNF